MASKHREQHIIDSVACPLCGAAIGERCRGIRGGRPPMRSDVSRRQAWQSLKVECSVCHERHIPGRGPAGYACHAEGDKE
jgi:hypothetical protein